MPLKLVIILSRWRNCNLKNNTYAAAAAKEITMKFSIKRALALCAIVLVMAILSACGGNTGNNAVTTVGDTDTVQNESSESTGGDKPDLPDVNYNNYEFRIYNTTFASSGVYYFINYTAEYQNGDVINDATFNRNSAVEQKYGVKIVDYQTNVKDVNKISVLAMSGDNLYDFYMLPTGSVPAAANTGMCTEFSEIPYVDITRPWWDQYAADRFEIGGKLYGAISDFELTHFEQCRGIYFNKPLFTVYGLEYPYKTVTDGNWTLEEMVTLSKSGISDLNGDGAMTKDDAYGIVCNPATMYGAILTGADVQIVIKGSDSYPALADFSTIIEKYTKIYNLTDVTNLYFAGGTNHECTVTFSGGNMMFEVSSLYETQGLRSTGFEFGILPYPKLDTVQENYVTHCPAPYIIVVPSVVPDIDRTGVILEALAYESEDTLIPAYFDTMLKGKVSNDSESGAMLDIIFSNIKYFIPIETAVKYTSEMPNMLAAKKTDVASYLESIKNTMLKDIEKTVEIYKGN